MIVSGDLDVARNALPQLRRARQFSEAEAVADLLLQTNSADVATQFELGLIRLAAGRFAEASAPFEARLLLYPPPPLPFPRWRGQVLSGKQMLVVAEPALNAGLVFGDFIPALVSDGAIVTYLCHPTNVAAAKELGANVIAMSGEVEFPDPHYWVPEGSIPGMVGHGSAALSAWACRWSA